MVWMVLAVVALVCSCGRPLPDDGDDAGQLGSQTVTYSISGAVSGDITVTIVTQTEGTRVISITPTELPWRYQTSYVGGIRHSIQARVTPVVRAAGTVTDDTVPFRLADAAASFLTTAQKNHFVYNVNRDRATIVGKVLSNSEISLGDDLFGAGRLGDAYRICERQSLGLMLVLHYDNGTEVAIADGDQGMSLDLMLDAP